MDTLKTTKNKNKQHRTNSIDTLKTTKNIVKLAKNLGAVRKMVFFLLRKKQTEIRETTFLKSHTSSIATVRNTFWLKKMKPETTKASIYVAQFVCHFASENNARTRETIRWF